MPESIVVFVIAIVGAGLTALGLFSWARLGGYSPATIRDGQDEEFSLERYRPMTRLLGGEDAGFLRRANCPKAGERWKRARRRILRLYLKELVSDFHRLHAKARELVAKSPEQYAGLVPILFRQQIVFRRAVATIEFRLVLERLNVGGLRFRGWNIGKISLEELVQAIGDMQTEISSRAATGAA